MLVIVEGLDGTGKSTIARRLRDEHGFEIIHKGPPTRPSFVEYTADLSDYSPGCGRNIVCDRWHVGEMVYPVTRGRVTDMSPEVFNRVEAVLRKRGAMLVYALASLQAIKTNLGRRGEPFDDKQITLERLLFEKALSKSTLLRQNVCLDRTLYEGYRSLQPILEDAEYAENFIAW